VAGSNVIEKKLTANHVSAPVPPCKYLLRVVDYQLQSTHWRWYADSSSTDFSSPSNFDRIPF